MKEISARPNSLRIIIHTDGACLGNPGPGGFGFIIRTISYTSTGEEEIGRIEGSGGETLTTNNRMELLAAIEAIGALPSGNRRPLTIISDSEYLVRGMKEWLPQWKASGWRKGDRKPVQNADLWKALDSLTTERDITWQWVRGHSGDPLNEAVDALAYAAAAKWAGSNPTRVC